MPPAARITDAHVCPGHPGGPVVTGASRTLIGFQPAARVADVLVCASPDIVVAGASNVLIEHHPAARLGDPTAHGGVLSAGCPTVLIGTLSQAIPLSTDAPFAEECEAKRAAREERERADAARRQAERDAP